MVGYIFRRILAMIPVLFFVALITFTLMHLVPGGPWDREKALPQSTVDNLNRKYNLNDPLPVQFARYLGNAVRGDLGVSFRGDRPVRTIIADGFRVSAVLGLLAMAVCISVGVVLGVLAALGKNGFLDYSTMAFATLGASMPSFILGTVLVVVLVLNLHWLPTGGWGTPKQAIMPVIALAAAPTAYLARFTRASMLEVLSQDFVRTARSKGLQEYIVVVRHIVKNALIPVLTLAGPLAAGLVTGSFIIEQFFSIPGIGQSFVRAVFSRDYGLIMGTTLFYAFIVAMANLVVDVLYGVVDPRIRYS